MRRTKKYEIDNMDILAADREPTGRRSRSEISYSDWDKKRLSRQRAKEKGKRTAVRVFLFLVLVALLFLFLKSSFFDIKEIKVEGSSYYTENEVISMSGAELGRNIIFDHGKGEIEEALAGNPYFKDVDVARKLPSTLIISVDERVQTAAVIFGGSYIVIDDEGIVLRKTDVDPKVTLLTGLTISKMTVGENLDAEEKENLATTLRILNAMKDGDMYFKKIDVSKVVIKAYVYDNLIVKGTPSEILDAIEKGELQKVVYNLYEDGVERGTIKVGGSSYISFTPELEDD